VVLLLVFIPITWGLAAFITSSITEPIGKLAQATTELAGGNLDHRIWLPGQKANELGALAIAFNNMADQLQDTIESLERYREHLEELVVERTHELQNVNQNLQREITERKQAEAQQGKLLQELVRSNKELEEFAYVASHDMQEPLRMIASYLKLLEKHYKGQLDPEANKFITYAVDGAKRMQQLINDLLRYSRVGTQEKLFAPTDCESVLEQALTNLRLKINDHQATITYDTLPIVVADQAQLLQLFQNLLGNAIKFHGRHPPEIHVGAVKRNGDWLFSVKDNGIGIEPEDTEHIFDIFQRLHHRGEYEGTGIGLAICKKIVERHDGRIWVESKPEQGAKFLFTIPQRDS
jgi:light-regulated signal transduction histidine kinase (bacteriophytochrome)/HAMP domain-containing protein